MADDFRCWRDERLSGIRTERELCGWLERAAAGEAQEYHRGLLVCDCAPETSCLRDDDRAELGRVRDRAMLAARQRRVHLLQRRLHEGCYSYLMIARPPSAALGYRDAARASLPPFLEGKLIGAGEAKP